MEFFRYSPGYVGSLADPEARDLLITTGLPVIPDIFTPQEAASGAISSTKSGRPLLRIGYSSEREGLYGINGRTGEVIYITEYDSDEFFANSSPVLFSQCLIEFQNTLDRLPPSSEYDDTEVRGISDSLKAVIARLDPLALLSDSGFWQSILDDIAIGNYCDEEGAGAT